MTPDFARRVGKVAVQFGQANLHGVARGLYDLAGFMIELMLIAKIAEPELVARNRPFFASTKDLSQHTEGFDKITGRSYTLPFGSLDSTLSNLMAESNGQRERH